MADGAADLDALGARQENRDVLEALRRGATPRDPDDPYAIDAFTLRTHPDLSERLADVAGDLRGGRILGIYGYSALVCGDVVCAVAMGTGHLRLRIADPAIRDEIAVDGGTTDPELGRGWIGLSAWLTDVPRAEGTARLRRWVAAAADETRYADA